MAKIEVYDRLLIVVLDHVDNVFLLEFPGHFQQSIVNLDFCHVRSILSELFS